MDQFSEIWLVDFEFAAPPGAVPDVRCLVAREYRSGQIIRLWRDQLQTLSKPPYPIGKDSLLVAYYSSAEWGCHLALEWELPVHVLDLFAEFRLMTNGLPVPCGNGLLGALAYFGLPSIETAEKDNMRDLALRGGNYSSAEQVALLDYCQTDVEALARLLPAMLSKLDLQRALLRGRYMKAAAQLEFNGIPLDVDTLNSLQHHWAAIQDKLISEIDQDYGVFDGRTFKAAWFADWLVKQGIPWSQLPTGALDFKDDTFREMARAYPEIAPLRELRVSLSQMRLSEMAVGPDGRNRCLLSVFRARTGRNQPSNAKFIFGTAVWLRSLIKPKAGYGVAYIDWSQQEFGIAAALSGDPLMKDAYLSGDPYLAFAKQAGAVPADATKKSHKAERDQFKACVLAVQYGMGAESLAQRISQPVIRAKELLRLHQQTYHVFWKWSDAAVDYAMLHGTLWTVFGWRVQAGRDPNPRFLRNFLMQGTGSREHIVAELRWEWEIRVPELDTSIFLVPGEFTKNRTTCLLVLNSVATKVIDSRRGKTDSHVFGFRGKPVIRMNNTAWKKAWQRAGLPVGENVLSGPHNLRHTFARRLRLAGVPLETRKALMHHIDGDITVHYSPAEVGELLAAVEKLTKVEGVTMLRLAS